jgi:hypothetical protein
MVVSAEMLTDLVTKMGAVAVWPVAAGAVGLALLRKYGWLPRISQLESVGSRPTVLAIWERRPRRGAAQGYATIIPLFLLSYFVDGRSLNSAIA